MSIAWGLLFAILHPAPADTAEIKGGVGKTAQAVMWITGEIAPVTPINLRRW